MDKIFELIKEHNSTLLNINEGTFEAYIEKLRKNATFVTHIEEGEIVAFLAFYTNNENINFSYATMLIVEPRYRRYGLATQLMKYWLCYAKNKNYESARVEVNMKNSNTLKMCEKIGFKITEVKEKTYILEQSL
ncbi:GNAT family N-acetyltransferase [Winogradskyella forsetii]|uniref:GNAT family N-acetyltransferase n=1 Tax=Winogradskyella forsetii TaxID=2686077 RepID=UPI0015C1BA9D|nr:GNAT family N-acetyltransferase [Winogradskyella forsetii]